MKQCINCKFWDRTGSIPGKMPGVRDNYRICQKPKMIRKPLAEWRGPTDSCMSFDARDESSAEADDAGTG